MAYPLPFSEDVRDATQEICNVAMGVAGEALAEYAGVFVELPIPKIRFVDPESVTETLGGLRDSGRISGVIREVTLGESVHYALVAITEEGLSDLARQRDFSINNDSDAEALLKELADVITRHCLPTLEEQVGLDNLQLAPVQLIEHNCPLETFSIPQIAAHEKLMAVEINYHLEGHPFNCDLVLLLPETAVPRWVQRVEEFL
jgi:chemotaxis protein CheY-P-specific phosphatase CheC